MTGVPGLVRLNIVFGETQELPTALRGRARVRNARGHDDTVLVGVVDHPWTTPPNVPFPSPFNTFLTIDHSAGFALRLHAPWDRPSPQYDLRLWREASRIG